jgi:hypothetical protein
MVTVQYLQSLLAAKAHVERLGARVVVDTIANESLIPRARDACAARFLAARGEGGEPFTHLFFIDADVGFPPWAIERLVRFGEPVTAAAYPLKRVAWARAAELAHAGRAAAELEAVASDYALEVELPATTRDDFIAVRSTGTGFLCVARAALEQMAAGAVRYENAIAGYAQASPSFELAPPLDFRALFTAGVDAETGAYLSEDYTFCRRWRALGGAIWVDLRAPLVHVGAHEHRGDVALWLESVGAIRRG